MFLIAALVAACLAVPAQAMTHREYLAWKHCEQGIVKSCIHRAAIHRGVDYDYMLAISYRESRWNPLAKNPSSTASGLFQFLTSTWANTPYAGRPIFSAKWNALAAGWAMQRGYYSWWAATG